MGQRLAYSVNAELPKSAQVVVLRVAGVDPLPHCSFFDDAEVMVRLGKAIRPLGGGRGARTFRT